MDLHILFLMGIIPVVSLIVMNWWIGSRSYQEPVSQRYRLLLALGVALILLGMIGGAAWITPPGDNRPLFPIAPFLGPALLASLILIFLNLRGVSNGQARLPGLVLVLWLASLTLLMSRNERFSIILASLLAVLMLFLPNLLARTRSRAGLPKLELALGVVVLSLLVGLLREQSGIVFTVLIGALVLGIAWSWGSSSDGLAVALSLAAILLWGW